MTLNFFNKQYWLEIYFCAMCKKFKALFSFIFLLFHISSIFAQQQKDTIYFDEDWSICEQPVAEYYRVCELNKEKQIFYKGEVEDYFIDGKLEMTGSYSDNGYKNGEFVFYNHNGTMLKKGNYVNDEMNGNWFYYDSTGNLKVALICKSSTDFTPLLIINNNSDTLLKNGNGNFSFNTQKDLPNIFPVAQEYVVQGSVVNNLKDGTFDYYSFLPDKKFILSETYQNGVFKKGKQKSVAFGFQSTNSPSGILNLSSDKLDKIDRFYHSNLVFGFGMNSDQKLINFLINDQFPEIESSSKSFYDNDRIIFEIIAKVLQRDLLNSAATKVSYSILSYNPLDVYYKYDIAIKEKNSIPLIRGDIALTIDTSGQVINSAFNSTLTKLEIYKINYYLSHVTDLIPFENTSEKIMANINLKLETVLDTLKKDTLNVKYIVFNSDSVDQSNLAEYTAPQIEAKFPGGQNAWNMYLERNLNPQVAAMHHAPNGNYTVTVSFMVDEKGKISDVQALNDPGYGTAEEAIRVIKNGPNWAPAIQNGKSVIYRQKQNITFQVSGQ